MLFKINSIFCGDSLYQCISSIFITWSVGHTRREINKLQIYVNVLCIFNIFLTPSLFLWSLNICSITHFVRLSVHDCLLRNKLVLSNQITLKFCMTFVFKICIYKTLGKINQISLAVSSKTSLQKIISKFFKL